MKNIQKITQSMKVVSTAKFARAEKELKEAKTYGTGAQGACICVLCFCVGMNRPTTCIIASQVM